MRLTYSLVHPRRRMRLLKFGQNGVFLLVLAEFLVGLNFYYYFCISKL